MALFSLRADGSVAPVLPAVPSGPIPNGMKPLWTPTTSTLTSSAHEAVMVDDPFTSWQTKSLADYIEDLFADIPLTYIYVIHGRGDHFSGLSTLW